MDEETLVMWTVGQIADRDNVSKQAVSKAVKKLIDEKPDTPVERDGQGRVMQISLAHYDHHRQRFVNPAKAKAEIRQPDLLSATPSPPRDLSTGFDEARRQAEWLKVGRERIRHQEAIGDLLRKDMVDRSIRAVGTEIQSIIRRLPNKADDLALAISKEGVHGVRVALRQIAFDIGNEIANRLIEIATAAPTDDELIEDDAE